MSTDQDTIEPVQPARCHDGSVGYSTVHINRPSSTRFIARAREPFQRRWTIIGKPSKESSTAIGRLARYMADHPRVKHGDVALTADWYDALIVFEMRRK